MGKTASSIFFAFCFQALYVIASAQLNNYVADIEVTDNGIKCVTPCGQDGLHEGRYWCHTSDATDTWDYCNLQYKVETSVVKNVRNTRLRPRVSKTGIIDK